MTQPQIVKVFTPIKRVPMVIGKAQNGQKLPFGPYTLPQVTGVAVGLLLTSALALTLPANPAITFLIGLGLTVLAGFGLGLIPYTGVRLSSRVLWVGRLVLDPKPVSASGMPVTAESGRLTSFIEETVVAIVPENGDRAAGPAAKSEPEASSFLELFARNRAAGSTRPAARDSTQFAATAPAVRTSTVAPASWRAMTNGHGTANGHGGKADAVGEKATNGVPN